MKKPFEQEALDRGMAPADAKVIGKVADYAYDQERKKLEAEAAEDYKVLKKLLRTPQGCAHVTAELLIALENHDLISPGDPGHAPDVLMANADTVLHIVKSRETREGWVAVKFPVG